MKTSDKIAVTRKIPFTKRPHNHRPTEARAIVVPGWAPQPSLMTREEIQKQVIDQIG